MSFNSLFLLLILNYLHVCQSEISMENLFCWQISKLLNPYLGQLVVYKPRVMTLVSSITSFTYTRQLLL